MKYGFPTRDQQQWFSFLPFVVMVFILPFPGTVAVRLICLVFCVAIALRGWRSRSVPGLPCHRAIALWAIVSIASLTYAVDFRYSAGEIKNEVGYALLTFAAFFVCTRDESRLRWVLASVVASGVVISLWALGLRFLTGYWDESARHGGTGAYGSLSVVLMPVVLCLWFLWPRARPVWAVAGLLTVAAAYFSYQRAVWPIFAVEALLAAFLLARRYRIAPNRRIRLNAAVAIAILFACGGWFAQGAKVSSYGNAAAIDRDSRVVLWPAVARTIIEHPISGAGFGREAMKLGYPELLVPDHPHFWHAHNVFLNYGLAMGLAGLAVLIVLFSSIFIRFLRLSTDRENQASIIGLTGALLVLALVLRNLTNDFFVRDAALLFWALCGALFGAGLREKARQR